MFIQNSKGNVIFTVAPLLSCVLNSNFPPWAFIISIDNGTPNPVPFFLVVKNGS